MTARTLNGGPRARCRSVSICRNEDGASRVSSTSMSGRVGRLQVGLIAASLLGTAAILFGLLSLEGARIPSAAECVDDWNERAEPLQRAQVTMGGLRFAVVHGWLAKLRYPGCSIAFIDEPNERLSCSRTFWASSSRLTHWSCEVGTGVVGVARAPISAPNAKVQPDGYLIPLRSQSAHG